MCIKQGTGVSFNQNQAHVWLQSLCRAMTKPLTYGLLLTFFPFKQNPFHKFQREITTQSSKLLLLLTLISSSVLKILRGHTKLLLIYVKIYWNVKKLLLFWYSDCFGQNTILKWCQSVKLSETGTIIDVWMP